jgi:hypothetical protein
MTFGQPAQDGSPDGPLQPEVLDEHTNGQDGADGQSGEGVTSPTKLIRIASMVRALLDEARRAPLDDAGRRLLAEIHQKSLNELEGVLSNELRDELTEVSRPFTSDTPSDSELRIAQAQLVGWLEGLFHGIQATLYTQQMAAQRQFEEMRQGRMLPGGAPESPTSSAYL